MEAQSYPILESWLQSAKACHHTQAKFRFRRNSLLEADVAGWVGEKNETRATFACEMKAYSLPIGSGGYGSIGQALLLKSFVDQVYVGCIADRWQADLSKRSTRDLLVALDVAPAIDFDGYLRVAADLFSRLFDRSGLGLLVVLRIDAAPQSGQVIELVSPRSDPPTMRC